MEIALIGKIDLSYLEEHYSSEVVIENQEVDIDVYMEDEQLERDQLEVLHQFLENIISLEQSIRTNLQKKWGTDPSIEAYINYHLSEFSSDEIEVLLADCDKTKEESEQVLSILHPISISFYPHEDVYFALFDYTISDALSSEIIAVFVDNKGQIQEVNWES